MGGFDNGSMIAPKPRSQPSLLAIRDWRVGALERWSSKLCMGLLVGHSAL
jgi:hypothetical protein